MLCGVRELILVIAPVREAVRVTLIFTAQLFFTVKLAVKSEFLTLVTATRLGIVALGGLHITANCGLSSVEVMSVSEQASATGNSRQSFDRVRIVDPRFAARADSPGRAPARPRERSVTGREWNFLRVAAGCSHQPRGSAQFPLGLVTLQPSSYQRAGSRFSPAPFAMQPAELVTKRDAEFRFEVQ